MRRQTAPPLETIVVVDNNPALFARVRQRFADAGGVLVCTNDGQPGLSDARNAGVAASAGEVVAFLDDDAVADPDWLARLTSHYRDARVLGVGGAIVPCWVGGRPRSFPPEFDWVVGCTYRGLPNGTARVRNLIGANMSFRRRVFQAVGPFRSDFGRIGTLPLGCEETEFCLRATRRWRDGLIVYEPLARVVHKVPEERGTWTYFLGRCYGEGLSKAGVARSVGSVAGLATERRYVLQTLTGAILTNVAAAARQHDVAGIARAARIALGVLAATAGYCVGTVRLRR